MLPARGSGRQKETHKPKIKGQKNISHVNGNQKKTGIAVLILDNVDFNRKTVIRDRKDST